MARLCVMWRRVMCGGAAVRDGDAQPRCTRGFADVHDDTFEVARGARTFFFPCTPSLLFAMPRRPNILVFLIDDLDLERIPFYSRLDAGAAAQKSSQAEGYSCKHGSANCTYAAPSIEAIGAAGVRFLGAHVPISVCTPSRYAILTGRLPSSSPFYLGHAPSAHIDELGSGQRLPGRRLASSLVWAHAGGRRPRRRRSDRTVPSPSKR